MTIKTNNKINFTIVVTWFIIVYFMIPQDIKAYNNFNKMDDMIRKYEMKHKISRPIDYKFNKTKVC